MKSSSSQESKIVQFLPKHQSSSALWWVLQRISGFFVFLLVFFHMIVNHYLTALMNTDAYPELQNGIASFQAVQWKMQNPLYFWISILFVIFLMIHALNGFRMVVLDIATGHTFRTVVAILLLIIGVLVIFYAFILNSTIISLG